MSTSPGDLAERFSPSVEALLARVRGADRRATQRLAGTIDDFFVTDDARLDDAERARIGAMLEALVEGLEHEIVRHAGRLLAGQGEAALAGVLVEASPRALSRLTRAGLLRDPDLMRELIGRAREERMAEHLPGGASDEPERPGLLARLVDGEDRVTASAALAFMLAESGRQGPMSRALGGDLPLDLQHRLTWWVVGTLRERFAPIAGDAIGALDGALTDAARRSLAMRDEGERVEAAVRRLADAIGPAPENLAELMAEALLDRRPALAIALLAQALRLDYVTARDLMLDREGDRLWLGLRALDLPREAIARVGLALADSDPHRDLETFADLLDAIAAISPSAARTILAPLTLHPDFRTAMAMLTRGAAR
jgi:hypothetical protein